MMSTRLDKSKQQAYKKISKSNIRVMVRKLKQIMSLEVHCSLEETLRITFEHLHNEKRALRHTHMCEHMCEE